MATCQNQKVHLCGMVLRNLLNKLFTLLLLTALSYTGQAQTTSFSDSKELKPSLGFGVGYFNYFGDVNSNDNYSSLFSQLGYEFHVARKITNFADLGFSFLTGTMLGNERTPERNLNFRTNIYSVSVYATYNLDHFLWWSDVFNPYVSIGFESFEYNNKADLVDANGNSYNYWTDGTIRTVDQNSPFAGQATLMQRDYEYETDLRSANLDGFGKYAQLAIAIPVGLGFNLNLSDRFSFKFNSTFHYTFTDLIDNLSKDGSGARKGNAANDYFLFNSISLHYDLLGSKPTNDPADFIFPDYFALDVSDQDGDGVVDGIDICPFTPQGVKVDADGCPLDEDNDGVPNYIDEELTTAAGAFVNNKGQTLTDEDFYNQYLKYIDSAEIPLDILYRIAGEPQKAGQFRVLLGEFKGNLPDALANKFLAEGDIIGAVGKNQSTAYLTKKYGLLDAAEKRKKNLLDKGFPQATIVVWEAGKYYTLKEWEEKTNREMRERFKEYYDNKEQLEGLYAVKLGETSAEAQTADKSKFFEYEDVVVLEGDSNELDYVVGPFIDQVGAKQLLANIDRTKFPNAEVVKVRNEKAISTGISASNVKPNNNPSGTTDWNKGRKEMKSSAKAIKELEGDYVIDFGSTENPKTQAAINKIKARKEVVEIPAGDGSKNLITEKPQSDTYVRQEVEALNKQGIPAKVMKVENGKLKPVDLNVLKAKEQQRDVISNKQPAERLEVLNAREGEVVVDLGGVDLKEPEIKQVVEKVLPTQTIPTTNGEDQVISKELLTEEKAKELVKALANKGVESSVSIIQNGQIEQLPTSKVEDYKKPIDKDKKKLIPLNGAFAIDFGASQKAVVKQQQEEFISSGTFEQVTAQGGSVQLVGKEGQSPAELNEIINDLASKGIKASLSQVKDGTLVPVEFDGYQMQNNKAVSEKDKEKLLPLDGAFAIDFGLSKKPEVKQVQKDLASTGAFEEVTAQDGATQLVAKKGQSESEVSEIINDLAPKGIEAKLAKVENGALVPVKLANQFNSKAKEKLAKSEGEFALDFGVPNSEQKKESVSKLMKTGGFEEVIDEKGATQLIAKNKVAQQLLKEEAKNLTDKGEQVATMKVKDGDLIPVDLDKFYKKGDAAKLSKNEGNEAIDLGIVKSEEQKTIVNNLMSTGQFEKVTDESGATQLIAKTKAGEELLAGAVNELQGKGVDVTSAKIENGEFIVKDQPILNPEKRQGLLKGFEDAFILDFGKAPSNEAKQAKAELSKSSGVEVLNSEGREKLVFTTPKAKEQALGVADELRSKGIEVAVQKVVNGAPVAVKDSGIYNAKDEATLTKYDGGKAIDFGQMDTKEKKDAVKKLLDSGDFEQVIDEKGNQKLIAKTAEAEKQIDQTITNLQQKGETVEKAIVDGGQVVKEGSQNEADNPIVDNDFTGTQLPDYKVPTDESLSKLEDNYVVKLGTIDANTPMVERGKLLNAPNTVQVANKNGSIDVLSKAANLTEEPVHEQKAYFKSIGFDDAKVAFFRDGKADVLKKELLDGQYSISLGSYKSDVPSEEVNKIASISDVESMETFNPDMTTYTVGNFDTPKEAQARIEELIAKGFKPELVKYEDGKVKVIDLVNVFDAVTVARLNYLGEQSGLVKTDEVVFRVQLGAYRSRINEQVFRGVKTLAFPSTGGITKYVTGSFNTYQQAYLHKLNMRQMGFEGSFVVAYKDGKRIKVTDLVNQEKYSQVKQAISPVEKEYNKVVEEKPKPVTVNNNVGKQNSKPKISYRVQMGAYKGDEMADKLAQFPDVEMEVYGQYKRYLSGDFDSYAEANKHKQEVKNKGFDGAFIVAYSSGQRVAAPGQESNVISESDLSSQPTTSVTNTTTPEYSKSKIMIMVQVGLYRGDIPVDLQSKYAELPNLTKQVTTHGVIRYMSGNFKNLSEAAAFKEELIKKGFEGAFLVAYYENERIKVEEAVEILKKAR